MLLFDIDGTLSPTRLEEVEVTPGETARAFGFNVFIPSHLLNFLRSRDDIVLLSTWGDGSFYLPEAFNFKARVALMDDFSEKMGIKGKFEVVKALHPTGWADDHITPAMKKYAAEHNIATTAPKKGYITEVELKKFEASVGAISPRTVTEFDSKLHWTNPNT